MDKETDQKSPSTETKASKNIVPKIFGGFGFLTATITIISFIWFMDKWAYYGVHATLPITIGIIIAVLTIGLVTLLDKNQKFNQKLKIGKLSLKWLILFIGMILIPFLVFLWYVDNAGMTLTTLDVDMRVVAQMEMTFYFLTVIICVIIGLFLLLGVKNFKAKLPPVKIKRGFLVFTSMLIMVAAPAGAYLAPYYGTVNDNYLWDDGPYLTWDDDPTTSIVVSWLTKRETKTTLLLGTSETNMVEKSFGTEKYHAHHAKITGLTPDTTYYYKIENVNFMADHKKTVFSFKTAPTTYADYKFAVVGDMQPGDDRTQNGGKTVAEGLALANPVMVIQLGDVASTGGDINSYHKVLQNIPLYASEAPFMSAIGNHDYGGDGSKNFHELFPYNYNSSPSNYYSFDYQNAHFIMIDNFDSGHYSMKDSQKTWVENDLAMANATGKEWIFINFHHTILTTGTSGQNYALQEWLMPLADAYGVDAVFFGHDHHYEHWNYTYGNSGLLFSNDSTYQPTGEPVQYFCTAGGGAHLEVDYGLLTHGPMVNERGFYNQTSSTWETLTVTRSHWEASRYVDSAKNKVYAESDEDFLYYHAPDLQSYSTDNEMFGYMYGEQTLHYMLVEITNNGKTCTISARYPNGDVLMGPNNAYPQTFVFTK
jgi:Calcineurin-like phosphoesterase/Purple acid Phosphatase, N-terminal domain